uniref:ribonuclease H n=1 Tax=Geospiza parvula TaxID=87175 RepID=A0A8U8BUD3_GEOPR
MGFWHSCCGGRKHQAVEHFAWTIRKSIRSRSPESGRATSANCHLNSAPPAVSDESRCCENFGLTDEEEQEPVTRAEEAPPYNQLPPEEMRYALFTDGSCRIVGMNRKWKAAVWSPTRQVAQATDGEGGSSQLAELKAVQLALDIAEREKWPKLYLYTDSWMVANSLWGWLERWKKANWQRRGKPIWAADEWKDIAARLEKLPVKVRHVDAHVPKSRANEEHRNNEQVDLAGLHSPFQGRLLPSLADSCLSKPRQQ